MHQRSLQIQKQLRCFYDFGAEVLGVSSQGVESHKSFATHQWLQLILLSGEKTEVRKSYGVPASMGIIPGRVTFIIDKRGTVRHIISSQFQPEKHIE